MAWRLVGVKPLSEPMMIILYICITKPHWINSDWSLSDVEIHYAGGPWRPPPPQLHLRRSRDLAHASIPLAQTPWGLTGRAWLQAGAQQAVIAVDPSFKSLGIDSRNELYFSNTHILWIVILRIPVKLVLSECHIFQTHTFYELLSWEFQLNWS